MTSASRYQWNHEDEKNQENENKMTRVYELLVLLLECMSRSVQRFILNVQWDLFHLCSLFEVWGVIFDLVSPQSSSQSNVRLVLLFGLEYELIVLKKMARISERLKLFMNFLQFLQGTHPRRNEIRCPENTC